MNDFTKLNESIAKLGSALEAFWSGETPKRPPSDQPAIDAMTKQVEAIVASVPAPGTKLPIAKTDTPKPAQSASAGIFGSTSTADKPAV